MTLIISEITSLGIVMVADTAVTESVKLPSGKELVRVLNGFKKLQKIPYLSAGISMWGNGYVGSMPTDMWLSDFIESRTDLDSIHSFADELANELQASNGTNKEPMGLHLAGYVEVDGEKRPTLYHIRNVDGTYEHFEFHDFIAGHDYPPVRKEDLPTGRHYTLRNGDYGTYAHIHATVETMLPLIQERLKITIPYPNLQSRVAYHAAWVRFVSNLYGCSGLYKTIGADVDAIGIYPDGRTIEQTF